MGQRVGFGEQATSRIPAKPAAAKWLLPSRTVTGSMYVENHSGSSKENAVTRGKTGRVATFVLGSLRRDPGQGRQGLKG